jgi:hypothetical protein
MPVSQVLDKHSGIVLATSSDEEFLKIEKKSLTTGCNMCLVLVCLGCFTGKKLIETCSVVVRQNFFCFNFLVIKVALRHSA